MPVSQDGVVTLADGTDVPGGPRNRPHELSLQRGVAAYAMPRPRVGEIVVWYRHAQKMPNEPPQPAVVLRVNTRSVDIQFLGSATGKNSVAHIDDPRSKDRDFIGDNGAWGAVSQSQGPTMEEFELYKAQASEAITLLSDRIEAIQSQFNELNRKLNPKK